MQLAAELYGSERAFYLINGSTGGILAGIAAAAPPGSRVLMARGCHKSVYNAVELLGLRAAYLLPPADEVFGVAGSVTPQMVEQALEGENTALPTFVEARNQFELNYLRKLLQITKGNVTHAARMAGRNRTEFYKLLSRHELDANDFKE